MRKVLRPRNLNALMALALSASLAAFGCTTNRMPGQGEPTRSPAYTPASTGGTSSGTVSQYPPPMISSSTTVDPIPGLTARPANRLGLTADEAAAIMARHQNNGGGKFLGYANPALSGQQGYYSDLRQTGQFADPAAVNPQLTINSSISSPGGFPAITSGAGEPAVTAGVTSGAVIANGVTANAVAAGTATTGTIAAAPVFPTGVVGVTPTLAASGVSPSAAAATAPSATLSSSVAPSPTAATSGTGNVRLVRSNGRVTVTNQQ